MSLDTDSDSTAISVIGDIENMTVEQITSYQLYEQLYALQEFKAPLTRVGIKQQLQQAAKKLKVKTIVDQLIHETERRLAKDEKIARYTQEVDSDTVTNFKPDIQGKEYPALFCGNWSATENGIAYFDPNKGKQIACYHPIQPVFRTINIETGEEQITIAFKRGRKPIWNELTVPKEMVANSRQIISLAKYGVAVTSENAKYLVKFLADVENYNDDRIPLVHSSSKFGWHDNSFIPYDKTFVFDAKSKFIQLTKAVCQIGSFDTWLNHVRSIRASQFIEPRLELAASFSSVLIKFLGIACVIIDFNGKTEAGKTVMHMLAASVWACPDEGQYISDFMSTDTDLEVRADMLNNLPLILDDTSKINKRNRENLEQFIYNLSSGSGKKRSNKELGSERVRDWKNTIIVNGERPLNEYVERAGAINRIIEIDLNSKNQLFENPSVTADLVRGNYGFAGRAFIESLKRIDDKSVLKERHKKYCEILQQKEAMQKQISSMAAILLADELATKYIFMDGRNLSPKEVTKFISDKSSVLEDNRCYEYLIGVLDEKGQHFDIQYDSIDQWGEKQTLEDGTEYINFYVNAFSEIMEKGGFSRRAFTRWAKAEGLLRWNTGDNRDVLHVKSRIPGGKMKRYISLKIVSDLDEYIEQRHIFD